MPSYLANRKSYVANYSQIYLTIAQTKTWMISLEVGRYLAQNQLYRVLEGIFGHYCPVGKCKIWRRLQEVFIEYFLKTSSHLWEQLNPLTRGTSSGLPSSRLQDRCRRLHDVFSEHLLKTSSYLWEQVKPVTTGTSSGLPSSRLHDRCRRPQDVFSEHLLKTSSYFWEQLKTVN